MKRFTLLVASIVALVATSCVQADVEDTLLVGGDELVTISLEGPTMGARAEEITIGKGLKATQLQYAIYDEDWNCLKVVTDETFDSGLKKELKLRLVKNKTYNFVFWAQAPNKNYYTVNLGAVGATAVEPTISVAYGTDANDDYRDAFFGNLTHKVEGSAPVTVYLKRPFAQINFGTNDVEDAKAMGFDVANATTSFKVVAHDTLNLKSGVSSGDVTVERTFVANELPENKTLSTDAKGDYHWVAMNYILWPDADNLSLSTCEMTIAITGQEPIVVSVPNAPARRNWRTNLVGSLLTQEGSIFVEILPGPDGELPNNAAGELALLAATGGEITLTEDVVLEQGLNVTADMTINLNGHNITIAAAYNDANATASSAISNNAIMTLTGNGEIKAENNYTVRNYGTMIIDGVTVKNGIMNFGDLTVESGDISNDRSGKHTIYGNAAKLTINGGTFHNENAGNAAIFAYGGEVVINGGEFTIADGTATFGWTSCLLDAQGGAKYTIYGGVVKGDIRDYNNNTTVYGGTFTHSSVNNFLAAGYKVVNAGGLYYVLPEAIADAANAAGVTAVTETYTDVATAFATDNGETTLYVHEGVAYIAKYGEVAMSASPEGAVTGQYIVSNEQKLVDWPLKSAVVAEGIEVVGNRTFKACFNLESIVLPSTLTEIESNAFQSCSKLTSIDIPAGVTTFGDGAFYGCSSLSSINIPAGVTRIEKNALRETGLVNVEFHEGVTYFGQWAFRDCEVLKQIVINAPSFTVEADTFTNMALPYPNFTIYVANAEMKTYLEGMLDTEEKKYITVVAPNTVSTADEFNNALTTGGSISLQEDIDVTKIDLTNLANDVIIDANGKTITTASNYGVQVKAGKNITLKNAKVEMTVAGDYITYAAGLKIENGDYQGNTITLKDCEIRMCNTDWAYAVNMPASVKNLNLVIDGCTLEGAIALQCWGDNNKITVTNSKLICNYTTNAMYTSYCVALQGDGTNNSENNTLNISDCEFSYSGVDNFNSPIEAIYNSPNAINNTITVVDCTYDNKVTAY